ncbi:MAG TPA: Uma2 family endonuclease [Pyrinomonadaceae bacterium]|nr:Uma2 family endonuclease [Pyrinomonadaceae bacterium]
MTAVLTPTEDATQEIVIHFSPILKKLSEREFFEFCMLNRDLNWELTSDGDFVIMPPTTMKTGNRNFELNLAFGTWAKKDGTGKGFDSSAMFTLPNGAKRSPDCCWIRNERWEALPDEERESFSHIAPDFIAELRSRSDRLGRLQKKMEEYVANGVQLGWLIDPFEKKVYVYRPQAAVEILEDPETVSGDPLLRGFVLDVRPLWE